MDDPILDTDDRKLSEQRLIHQISEVTIAMGVAMRAFADAPGRKLFVPITRGWNFDQLRDYGKVTDLATAELARGPNMEVPAPPLQYLRALGVPGSPAANAQTRRAEQRDVYGDTVLSPLVDTANLLGYSVYPMHLGRSTQEEVLRTGLWLVARETGGQIATEGGAARLPLQPVVEDTGSYYVLAFSPERSFDDRRRTLEVVVEEPEGAEVRHRRSFTDLSSRTREIMELERQVLLEGSGGDLEVQVGKADPGRGSTLKVPVTVRIPMDWVTMVPQEEEGLYAADLELRVAAVDPQGRRSNTTSVPVELRGPEPAPGSHALYETAVQLRKAKNGSPQRLVLYLYDRVTGDSKMAAVELEL